MMNFKVSWWIHGAGKIVRGFDVVQGAELTEDDVTELIEEDLSRNLSSPNSTTSYKYDFPTFFTPNLPRFNAKHQELMLKGKHPEVSNWGILKIIPNKLNEKSEETK